MRFIIVLIVAVWLVIGLVAASQRHYFRSAEPTCAKTSTTVVTAIAGPLNYLGANPKATCHAPEPSK
jgi:hypothetical protein